MRNDIGEQRAREEPPSWGAEQRALIARMETAAQRFQERYFREDGSLVWRRAWPGIDGSDDAYESIHNWPLLYALGGSGDLPDSSRHCFEALTRQFTEYGQIHREFDGAYDWMHHGEGSLLFYYFGLAHPHREEDRACRFAAIYTGEDPEAPNWDPENRMIRSPINGSRGPRFVTTAEDWSTHRWVLSLYPLPFDDLDVPTKPQRLPNGLQVEAADWEDDVVFAVILDALNRRQMRCDVPLNLGATSLVTNAFLYTGRERYRRWVVDYVEAWAERIAANGGICPDNVGPRGRIGETTGGKWWGGYYGWAWPHGARSILEPLLIGAMNAVLLTGDLGYLEIPRGQMRRLLELGIERDGELRIPIYHRDCGWMKFRPPQATLFVQLAAFSQLEEDRRLIDSIPQSATEWKEVRSGRGKGDDIHAGPWWHFIHGNFPDYPTRILEVQRAEVEARIAAIESDSTSPEEMDVHHWQQRNPVHTEGLIQLTCGGPQVIYHGGLLHTRLRHFDPIAGRPGLPPDVGGQVYAMDADAVSVELVNGSREQARTVRIGGGMFGEHRITAVHAAGPQGRVEETGRTDSVDVTLPPASAGRFTLQTKRFCRTPSFTHPF